MIASSHNTCAERATFVAVSVREVHVMNKAPNKVSYAALLIVLNNRLGLPRTAQEQRYFIDLANELIRLYWQYDGDQDDSKNCRRAA